MNLHEYQAKKLFSEYGIAVPPGLPAHSIEEALRHADSLDGPGWVVKAQVHAGGRGKAGGVKLTRDLGELEHIARAMLGKRLVTKQSGPEGQPIDCILIQKQVPLEREFYIGMLLDRSKSRITVIASSEGGMDIEQVAVEHPERITRVLIDPILGLERHQCSRIGFGLGLNDGQRKELNGILLAVYRLFIDKDLSLVEINPLVVSREGRLLALDAKISVDDNALFRQSALEEWRDPNQIDPKEAIAKRYDLNYVALEGDIGCMVNGAGLAMATMDIIKLLGGAPANFLDVGGGTTAEKVAEAFKLIVSDPNVKAILVNIFGGIVRCDLIADGVIKAMRDVGIKVPVVVRLEGTNVAQGRELLKQSELAIVTAEDLDEAARKAVAAAKGD
ncbi:MAG: ADP-forming succinate--CoA ligase subunit beta [Gammaproteobacteria bacterium]